MRLVADLHTHTVSSGHAYSTVLEIAKSAQSKGLALVAITDHGPAMPGGPHAYHFGNFAAIPRHIYDVEILCGAEVNVLDRDGTIDLPMEKLCALDIVLAGLHTHCFPTGSVEENTQGMLAAMCNPFIDVIVHPGNPEFLVDAEVVVKAAADMGIAIEINNSSLTTSRVGSTCYCRNIAALARTHGALVSVGSDSHIALTVGEFSVAKELIAAAGIGPEQVINTSVERVHQYLAGRRAKRPR